MQGYRLYNWAEQMEPRFPIVTCINIVISNVFRMLLQRYPTLIIAANILGVFTALSCSQSARATSLVVLLTRKDHKIYIATDSLTIHNGEKSFSCKVKTFPDNNCTFALAGWKDFALNDAARFSFSDAAKSECQGSGTLREKADRFSRDINPEVASIVTTAKQLGPATLANLADNGDVLDVVFVGTEQGRVAVFARGFFVKPNGKVFMLNDEFIDDGKSNSLAPFLWSQ